MSDPQSGTVGALLHEVGNRDLYQRNAFHVTDLPSSVDRRAARHRQQQVAAMLQVGADLETAGSQDPDQLRAAFDRILGDPRRRLVDEVFGRWGLPDDDCGCEGQLHELHDLAVQSHAAAIEQVAELGQRLTKGQSALAVSTWHHAGWCWQQLLDETGFWQHLRNRVLVSTTGSSPRQRLTSYEPTCRLPSPVRSSNSPSAPTTRACTSNSSVLGRSQCPRLIRC